MSLGQDFWPCFQTFKCLLHYIFADGNFRVYTSVVSREIVLVVTASNAPGIVTNTSLFKYWEFFPDVGHRSPHHFSAYSWPKLLFCGVEFVSPVPPVAEDNFPPWWSEHQHRKHKSIEYINKEMCVWIFVENVIVCR